MRVNRIYQATCLLILLSVSASSVYLTYQFTYGLGLQAGMFPLLFGIIGITVDITKTFAPALALHLYKESKFTSFSLWVLASLLIGISGLASVSALEKSVSGATFDSREYKNIERRITVLSDEVSSLTTLSKTQLSANQITKSSQTQNLISKKSTEINNLISQQSNLKPDSLLTKYGSELTVGISVILELISIIVTLALSKLRLNTHEYTKKVYEAESPVNTSNTEVLACNSTTQNSNLLHVSLAKKEGLVTEEQLTHDIKKAILGGVVKPSHRGIKAHFKVTQKGIQKILTELHSDGLLSEYNNGYKLSLT